MSAEVLNSSAVYFFKNLGVYLIFVKLISDTFLMSGKLKKQSLGKSIIRYLNNVFFLDRGLSHILKT